MRIYGAGLAGLLAAHMLRRYQPEIHESQSNLPNNHAALLRFRTDAVSKATAIPFRKVRVLKGICFDGKIATQTNLFLSNLYSRKVTGRVDARSLTSLEPVDRFIAPPDFITLLSAGLNIHFNSPLTAILRPTQIAPIISTIPMPIIYQMLSGLNDPGFSWLPIWSVEIYLGAKIDVHQTLYYPEARLPYYRASITGQRLIIEFIKRFPFADCIATVAQDFGLEPPTGIPTIKEQVFGKLLPTENDAARKHIISHLTDEFGIYSLGRFATWRQILLDDVVHDIEVVDRLIQSSSYATSLQRSAK